MDIGEFLKARIAEDEAAAREAGGASWVPGYERSGEPGKWDGIKAWLVCLPSDDPVDSITAGETLLSGTRFAATHAARFDPARVLAECEAKRRIVELHKAWPVLVEQSAMFDEPCADLDTVALRVNQRIAWLTEQEYRERFGSEPPTAPMVSALAAVYADHPDYDKAWRLDS